MASSLRASEEGLKIVDLARKKKGWTKTALTWSDTALVGQTALDKFWARRAIIQENFVSICQAVGVENWQDIVEETQDNKGDQTSDVRWLLELKGTIPDVDKPVVDALLLVLNRLSPDVSVKTQKVDPGSLELLEKWQSVESVLPPRKTRSIDTEIPDDSIRRAKEIELGAEQSVILVVQRTLESESEVGIIVWVYPSGNTTYLPPTLQAIALDESDNIILEEQAGSAEDSIKLEFGVEPEELFTIQVVLGDVTVSEYL
jgi:hypothetical protein